MELGSLSRKEKLVRVAKTAYSLIVLMRDPSHLDAVLTVGDSVFTPGLLKSMIKEIGHVPHCEAALKERPRLGKIDFDKLRKLPAGTLGQAYLSFLKRNNLEAADIPMKPAKDVVAYARAHILETHDIWHTMADFEGDVSGELGLHGFYLAQMPTRLAPLMMGGGIIQTLRQPYQETDVRMRAIVRGWLMGKRAKPLFGVRWNDYWDAPLKEVREQFGVQPEVIDQLMAKDSLVIA